MTVVAIVPLSRVSCRIHFDSVQSRILAVSGINVDQLCNDRRFGITAVEGATAISTLNADDTERAIRMRWDCRMLLGILEEAAAKCLYGSGDPGLAGAWFAFVRSPLFRDALVAKDPHGCDEWLQSLDIDLREGVPLDRVSHSRAATYRDWARSPFFISLGEQWLGTL